MLVYNDEKLNRFFFVKKPRMRPPGISLYGMIQVMKGETKGNETVQT